MNCLIIDIFFVELTKLFTMYGFVRMAFRPNGPLYCQLLLKTMTGKTKPSKNILLN